MLRGQTGLANLAVCPSTDHKVTDVPFLIGNPVASWGFCEGFFSLLPAMRLAVRFAVGEIKPQPCLKTLIPCAETALQSKVVRASP